MLQHALLRPALTTLLAAGTLVAGASSAMASDSTGIVIATETGTATVTVVQTRVDTETATARLTRTIQARSTASARATRSATRRVTVTITRTAGSRADARAEAEAVAQNTARLRATRAAGAEAARAAHTSAARKARVGANRLAHRTFGTTVLRSAAALKGRPYRLGANGPRAFDCSGYARYVLKTAGVTGLPRTSAGMSRGLQHVRKSNRQVGDLILFGSRKHGVTHVGIYAGRGTIWHAPGTGRHVTRARIWTSHYAVARTV